MKYHPSTWTYGYELELSDVPRLALPPHLGTWDGCERDIVNTEFPFRGRAADPLGIDPPVGGEINTVPALGWQGQVDTIVELVRWFRKRDFIPGIGPTAHGHVHVHVPGLVEDIEALKNLTIYISENQADMVRICHRYLKYPDMDAGAVRYFSLDGARLMPDWMAANILQYGNNFHDFIRLQCCGKDAVSRGRPFRYAINTYCLKHTKTVEFRMFRGTLDEGFLAMSFAAVEAFMDAALNDGPAFRDLTLQGQPMSPSMFAPMQWDKELWDGLQATKHPDTRGKKQRRFVDVDHKT